MSGEQRRFELSVPQILGSALAAVTAAVAASYLGVAGTVIGAAVVSVASTVATAVYTHYLKQTGERVKQHTPLIIRREEHQGAELQDEGHQGEERHDGDGATLVMPAVRRWRLPWLKVGVAAALVFGLSMGGILVYQAAAQRTVHEQVTGKTPVKAQKKQEEERAPVERETRSVAPPAYPDPLPSVRDDTTPEADPTPTPSRTPKPTPKPTPTPTPTPSETVEPSQEGTTSAPPPSQEEDEPPADEAPWHDHQEREYDAPVG
ncbi:Proline-rich protein [[Actinomadura] parvosata subsp. kistnae]|uniref:Uncharacterized protein n=1 Tax=[Actinomadura] parvosata subsp. kistnae TaxID=1909395 RepID=A0A1U9ZQH1_9ACTN|nr:hypothetical protein [Nonomuraea sp. ATCC 55076]AQZ60190.1 hypothetical protein BKM31_00485 [Nonomuraea sp. ATCC 55076]SPL91333.1 Proline-rich protein [Actinomadura parvosata subsp. kistnae]